MGIADTFNSMGVEWVRRDPAVLAALPEVRALVDAALREGMRIATFVPIEQVPKAFSEAAAAIRAKGPTDE